MKNLLDGCLTGVCMNNKKLNNLAVVDYFATGEGRTIIIIYAPGAENDNDLLRNITNHVGSDYFNICADLYNVEDLKSNKEKYENVIELLSENTPYLLKELLSERRPMMKVVYQFHINKA